MNTPKDSTGGCCPPPPGSAFVVRVGDVYRLETPTGFRVWKCVGHFLGSTSEEDMVGLMALDRKCGSAYGQTVDIMVTPKALFVAANPERC